MKPVSKELKMARLHVALYKGAHEMDSATEEKEVKDLAELLKHPHTFEAAEKLQLPLPDLKRISQMDVRSLLEWKSEKLQDPEYDRHDIIKDIAAKYEEMKEEEVGSSQSTVIYSVAGSEEEEEVSVEDVAVEVTTTPSSNPENKRDPEGQGGQLLKRTKTIDPRFS